MLFILHHIGGESFSLLGAFTRDMTFFFTRVATLCDHFGFVLMMHGFDFAFILLGRSCSFMRVYKLLMHSTLFPLLNYGIDGALDRDMIISFTQETSRLRCGALVNWMFLFTIGALIIMLFG